MRQFFDTNVLVYAHDTQDAGKRQLARSLVAEAMGGDEFVISTQVLAEFYATAMRRRIVSPAAALDLVKLWGAHDVVTQTPDLVIRAVSLHQDHSLSVWDALIVQAALDAHCDVLLSEDMQHGRRFDGLEIRNPFLGTGAHEPRPASYSPRRRGKRRS